MGGGGGGFRGSCRVGSVLLFSAWVALAALSRLLRPVPNGCVMTYMYPTYIPIAAAPRNVSSDRYGLFLYHEGWKQIDFAKHIRGLRGVPVLFIPGNGASYKQVIKSRFFGFISSSVVLESNVVHLVINNLDWLVKSILDFT